MIELAFILSTVAIVIAILKKSRFMKLVILLAVVTAHFTTRYDPQNPYAGIGYAIIGSIIVMILSSTALILSFKQKTR